MTAKWSDVVKNMMVLNKITKADHDESTVEFMVQRLKARATPDRALAAVLRCLDECKRPFTWADIHERLDDGRPGPDEAWALIPRDEWTTVVWNDEIAQAWGLAKAVLDTGDKIGGRRTFIEAYTKIVAEARTASRAPKWTASMGHDLIGREDALLAAAAKGLISLDYVRALLPGTMTPKGQQLLETTTRQLKLLKAN